VNSFRYRVTVEKLSDAKGDPVHGECLSFYTANHDDILAIVERMQAKLPMDAGTAASLGVGLKLFSEVALIRKDDPMFAEIRPAVRDFMMKLKGTPAANAG
jgi:hypothetical protein